MATAAKALSIATAVRSLINVEKKWFDAQNTGYPTGVNVVGTGTVYHLSNILQGDTSSSREGNSVKLSSIYVTGSIGLGTGATSSQRVRLILFRDNDNQGALPTVTSVLLSALISSPMALTNPGRFSVLMDKTYMVYTANSGPSSLSVKKYIKNKYHIKYGGNAGTIADARTGNLFLLAISDTTANDPFLVYDVRLRYIDN